jgi:hypothetical protein
LAKLSNALEEFFLLVLFPSHALMMPGSNCCAIDENAAR